MNKGIGFKVFWESPTLFNVEQDNIKSFYLPLGGVPIPTQSSGSSTWGNIGGNIDNQTDLKFKLDSKQDTLPTDGEGTKFLSDDGIFKEITTTNTVTSVNGKIGDVVLSASDIDVYSKGDIDSALDYKVDKDGNKVLSTNDYTDNDKAVVDILNVIGNGDKFLSDDGTYKSVSVDVNDFYTKEDTNTLLNTKVDKEVNKGLSANDYTTLDKDKLSNIEKEATKNSSDSYLLDRVNHTGVQPISSVEGLQDELDSIPKDLNQLTDSNNLLFDKDYNSLTNKPTIPTNNNQLVNGEEFIKDAPKDSKQYARKDGSWSEVTSSGGGATETEVKGWISRNIAVNNAYSTFIDPPKIDLNAALALAGGADARGTSSIAIGTNAKTTTIQSIAIGRDANVTHGYGVAVGYQTQSAQGSVSLGQSAKATTSDCVAVGRNTSASFASSVSLGVNSSVTATFQNQIGSSNTTTYVYGSVQDRSDVRDKTDIKDISLGLDFLNQLRPVEYKWDYREDYFKDIAPNRDDFETEEEYRVAYEQARKDFFTNPVKDGSKTRTRYHTGLIAQELKQTLDDLNTDFGGFQHHQEKGGLDVMSIGYTEFIAVLIKSVQELSDKCNELKGEIDEFRKDIQ